MSTSTNIYEDILGNIDADKKAWCQGSFCLREDGNDSQYDTEGAKPVSRCLVEHVDLALGTAYVKPNGKVFVSKDKRKWARRTKVLAHLASLLPKEMQMNQWEGNPYEVLEPSQVDTTHVTYSYRYPGSNAAGDLIEFNDEGAGEGKKARTKVRNLLKRAAKRFPED